MMALPPASGIKEKAYSQSGLLAPYAISKQETAKQALKPNRKCSVDTMLSSAVTRWLWGAVIYYVSLQNIYNHHLTVLGDQGMRLMRHAG